MRLIVSFSSRNASLFSRNKAKRMWINPWVPMKKATRATVVDSKKNP